MFLKDHAYSIYYKTRELIFISRDCYYHSILLVIVGNFIRAKVNDHLR